MMKSSTKQYVGSCASGMSDAGSSASPPLAMRWRTLDPEEAKIYYLLWASCML